MSDVRRVHAPQAGRPGAARVGGSSLGLFGRARNLIKGLATDPEAEFQYYNVVCPLGHRVRGQRTEGYQALRCPACGEGVFVLPVSPLPDPGPRVATPASRRAAVDSLVHSRVVEEGPIELEEPAAATIEVADSIPHPDAEISWEDDDPAPRPTVDRPREPEQPPGRRPAKPRRNGREAAASPQTTSSSGSTARSPASRPSVAVERRGRRNGVRPAWIFGLVGLVVVATILLRLRASRMQELPQVAELGRVEGIPALEAGDFDKANQILAPARRAVDALGGEVEGAERIRQAADEAALYVALASSSLEEMLDEAAPKDPKRWAVQFGDQYRGRGVVFDTHLRATPEGSEGRYEIDYVVFPVGDAGSFRAGGARPERSARIDLSGFDLFELAAPKAGDHVVFGARLAALEFDAASNGWVVRLEPKSGLFVQFHKALESLGWPDSSETALSTPVGADR